MIYVFYVLCLISGIAVLVSGVKCFTVSGRKKIIESKKQSLNSMLDWGVHSWNILGILSLIWGIISITFAVKLFMGA